MKHEKFWQSVEQCLTKYDLLQHPFYKAWSAGTLTRAELCDYASNYYHHVDSFPRYLESLEQRLPAGALRDTVQQNRHEELGGYAGNQRSHAEIWLDFAESMGANRSDTAAMTPIPAVQDLTAAFSKVANSSSPAAALTSFYAYESQVPKVSEFKSQVLKDKYAADDKATAYFDIHATADIAHSMTWRRLIDEQLDTAADTDAAEREAIETCETAASALWSTLDAFASECHIAC